MFLLATVIPKVLLIALLIKTTSITANLILILTINSIDIELKGQVKTLT